MRLKRTYVKDYLSVSKLPNFDYVINPYVGCTHACTYCYAVYMKKFTNHEEAWGTFLDIKFCDNPIKVNKLIGKNVFMSSVTDCYNHYERRYQITRSILLQLIDVDCNLTITTKSKLILRDLDLLTKFKNLTVAISINTLDEGFKNDMDKASKIKERIEVLRILHEHKIKTVLFMSPIFPFISDVKAIIKATKDYVDTYWLEDLNLRGDYKKGVLKYIKDEYPMHYQQYQEIYINNNYSYFDNLITEIDSFCISNQINHKNLFHHQQLVRNINK